MLSRIASALGEPTMGFFALAALSLGLARVLFVLPEGVTNWIEIAGWAIVGLFALEFAVRLAVSADRRKFLLDPWRVLDAAIIVAALLSLIPAVPDALRSAPALRILQLLRILLFGPPVVHGLLHADPPQQRPLPVGEPQVSVLGPGDSVPRKGGWDKLLKWASAPTSDWVHASNLAPDRLVEIASAAGVPRVMIDSALHESSFPRLESGARWTALTISLPSLGETIRRDPVLLLITKNDVLSLTSHALDLQRVPMEIADLPWGPRCAFHIIHQALTGNEELSGRLERTVRHLEQLPTRENPEDFFRETFRLKRILSTVKGDLWRLKGLLEMLADGRRTLPGLGVDQREMFAQHAEDADYLYETVDNVRESVLSLIELHIAIAAHDTNRFIRLLAVVSTLAVIPTVAGGLLGMNLAESPWPVSLEQVAFGTLVLALAVLYIFMAKGWLR